MRQILHSIAPPKVPNYLTTDTAEQPAADAVQLVGDGAVRRLSKELNGIGRTGNDPLLRIDDRNRPQGWNFSADQQRNRAEVKRPVNGRRTGRTAGQAYDQQRPLRLVVDHRIGRIVADRLIAEFGTGKQRSDIIRAELAPPRPGGNSGADPTRARRQEARAAANARRP